MTPGTALIIDDEADVAAYQGSVLSDHGWHVRTACSGDEGLALALDQRPDVILLDLMMPGGRGGLSVFLELSRYPDLKTVPVVFVTAFPQPDENEAGNFLGSQMRRRPAAYLEKPVNPETLLATARRVTGTLDQPTRD